MQWRPTASKDLRELAGPMKRVAPRGLLLANPGKQAPVPDAEVVECGVCHKVIYRAVGGGFNSEEFRAERKKHYAVSPGCETKGG